MGEQGLNVVLVLALGHCEGASSLKGFLLASSRLLGCSIEKLNELARQRFYAQKELIQPMQLLLLLLLLLVQAQQLLHFMFLLALVTAITSDAAGTAAAGFHSCNGFR